VGWGWGWTVGWGRYCIGSGRCSEKGWGRTSSKGLGAAPQHPSTQNKPKDEIKPNPPAQPPLRRRVVHLLQRPQDGAHLLGARQRQQREAPLHRGVQPARARAHPQARECPEGVGERLGVEELQLGVGGGEEGGEPAGGGRLWRVGGLLG